jgi:hypothetical protein
MADLNLYITNAGLRIISDVSDVVYNEYSTKRNLRVLNELSIVSDIKNNYAEYTINFNEWDNIYLNDSAYTDAVTLQDDLQNISASITITSNGKNTGTLFGDDIRTTRRVPVASGKYSQGLPLYAINYDIVGTGYWEIVNDSGLNGASEFGTGTDSNGKIYVSSKGLNRYQPGQLSYYIFTACWPTLSTSNGNFVALIGASLPGLAVDGQAGDIKEGFMFGWVREDGDTEPKPVMRVYKGFSYTQYDCQSSIELAQYLSIFELEVGYLGIHPSLLYRVDTLILKQDLIKKITFTDDKTSVNDPNMAISAYLENQGNTTNITVRNGSFQYGNYAERPSGDPSSRELIDTTTFASVASGIDTVVGIFTVPDKVDMQSRLDSTGIAGATISEFRNTIRNKLKKVVASAESGSNKIISLSIYLVPAADVTGTNFLPINPYINVIESSSIGTVSFTNAIKIVELADLRSGDKDDVRLEDHLLDGSLVGVITVTSTGNILDLRYTIITEDQF